MYREKYEECERAEADTTVQGFAKQGFRHPSTQQNAPLNECHGVESHGFMVHQASH
jgi:hypothetical protein